MTDLQAILDKGGPWQQARIIGGQLLIQGDCREVMAVLPKVDACLTDPPYGMKIDKWDEGIDHLDFAKVAHSTLSDDKWFCFFGQEPSLLDWQISARSAGFKFSDHIVWVKRIQTALALPLNRTHESIMCYKKGTPKHHKNKGLYSDVRVDMLHTMPEYITGIKRRLSARNLNAVIKPIKEKTKSGHVGGFGGPRHPNEVNFTNVWSFLPENNKNRNRNIDDLKPHPTMKPVDLMARLCEVFAGEGDTILDPFMGSGTTLVACQRLGRQGIGIELDPDYFEIACRRVQEVVNNPPLFTPAPPKPTQEAMDL